MKKSDEVKTMQLSDEQRDIIMHSLGEPTKKRKPYRNYFCAANGDPKLEALVAIGAMKHGYALNEGRDRYYLVTEAGAAAVGFYLPKD